MEKTLQDLIQDVKSTTLYYAILIALLAFCLSLTSNFFWFNIPISILILSALRLFSLEIELQWRMSPIYQESYHSHLNVQSSSHSDPLLFSSHISKKWNRRIDSPVVAAAVDDFIVKIVNVFIMDLWYSSLTPDQEFPNQIRSLLNDVMGGVVQRLKHINLTELLTRDVVDLIGSHIELYRRNQACIGVDVMETLSLNERDERLKHYLASSKELHPALISSDTECKVLQQLMGGVVAIVLRPQDVQCPIVRSIARELLACAVMQPIMDFASPMFINELIEFLVLSCKEEPPNGKMDADEPDIVSIGKNTSETPQDSDSCCMQDSSIDSIDPKNRFPQSNRNAVQKGDFRQRSLTSLHKKLPNDQIQVVCDSKSQSDDSPKLVEAESQRRTEVPAHDTHGNLWAKARSYKLNDSSGHQYSSGALIKSLVSQQHSESKLKEDKVRNANDSIQKGNTGRSTTTDTLVMEGDAKLTEKEKQGSICCVVQCSYNTEYQDVNHNKRALVTTGISEIPRSHEKQEESRNHETQILKVQHRRSKSGGAELERWQKFDKLYISGDRGSLIPKNIRASEGGEVYGVFHTDSYSEAVQPKTDSIVVRKLDCWVLGVHFEKVGMKSIAVYSIAVTNSENKTWLVDRRYQNFEQLHRHLREIPNYKLHLPPKSFISSNLDDYFLRKRCILLDKYLKDLLSMPNIAEQHEVWDFLSATSKNYSFGKRTSVMETLAYNVDDAMVDIICQFKGVSSGLKHSIVGSVSATKQHYASETWKSEGADLKETNWDRMNRSRYLSDEEEHVVGSGHGNNFGVQTDGWLSDTELHEEHFGSLLNTTPEQHNAALIRERNRPSETSSKTILIDDYCTAESLSGSEMIEDEFGGPPEWTPPKLSVPLLNLVERVFQLRKMGWLRQQVLWIGKQILHLVMEDLIDNWLLRQIQWLRREDVIVAGIRQVQDVVLAKVIFTKENSNQQQMESTEASNSIDEALDGKVQTNTNAPESLQFQLEEVHRESLVYDIILGAPAPLVTVVGREQYNRCAKDIYFFLQSTVCVKQLAYSLLELFLITIFPELHDLVCDIRNQSVLL